MTVGGAKPSRSAKRSLGVRVDARRRVACALSLVAALTNACGARSRDSSTRGAATGNESETDGGAMVPADSGAMVADGGAMAPDSGAIMMDAGTPSPCTGETARGPSLSVAGTIRGAGVDAVLNEAGFETTFLGPQEPGPILYSQSFGGGYDAAGKSVDEFAFAMPSDVVTASFSGWAGATAAEVGSYRSQGWTGFVFEMAFPIPAGVVCPVRFGPCGAQCEPVGEAGICQPAYPKLRYRAWREASSFPSEVAGEGEWQLELTSVCSLPISETFVKFKTHGHLNATLINEADASDSVEVRLDF
jgi:hypothetical protein